MAFSRIPVGRDPTFERFLGATVGEDRRGASVTVLSMLARLDVDPWDEASDLTAMPEDLARERLCALLARFGDVPTLVQDRARLVSGWLACLPRHGNGARASAQDAPVRSAATAAVAPLAWIIAAGLLVVLMAVLANGR